MCWGRDGTGLTTKPVEPISAVLAIVKDFSVDVNCVLCIGNCVRMCLVGGGMRRDCWKLIYNVSYVVFHIHKPDQDSEVSLQGGVAAANIQLRGNSTPCPCSQGIIPDISDIASLMMMMMMMAEALHHHRDFLSISPTP